MMINKIKNYEKMLKALSILIIFILAIITRSAGLISKDYVFGFDQGRDYLAAWNIAVNHKLTLIGAELGAGSAGMGGLFHGPIHYYTLVIPFILMGGDPYGGLILTFIFGLASIFAGFVLGRMLFNFWGGILISSLIVISPQFITQSYFVWNSHPTTFFIILMLIFTYLMKDKKIKYTFLAAFFAGFSYNFELAIAIPLSFTLIIYLTTILRLKDLRHYLALFIGFCFAYSPMLLFEIRHKFMAISGLLNYILAPKATDPHNLTFYLLDHLNSFYFNFTDTFPRQVLVPYLLIILIIPLSIFFVRKETDSYLKKFLIFCLLLIPCNFLVFAFLKNSVYTYYLLDLNIIYIIIYSYLIIKSIHFKNFIPVIILFFLFSFFTITAFITGSKTFAHDVKDTGGLVKMSGKKEAIDYIYQDANGEKFGLFIYTGPIYTYPYDYILTWYAAEKYGYVPHKDKKGLVYLLIEVDTGRPHTYKGWLETVIKDGKVIKTETLPSGLILQKRLFPTK